MLIFINFLELSYYNLYMSIIEKNKFSVAIKNMSDLIYENQISDKKVFPVSSVIMDKKGQIITKKINEKKKQEKEIKYNEHHAEFLCLKSIDIKQNKKLFLFVTIPPCEFCYKNMMSMTNKTGITWEIYYLNDDIREKISNKFWESFKNSGHKIKKLYISKLNDKESEIRMLYCINTIINAFASHKNSDQKIIKTKMKNHKIKMQIYFRSLRASRNQVQTEWVYKFYKKGI